jgi:hypothetical protein
MCETTKAKSESKAAQVLTDISLNTLQACLRDHHVRTI